MSSPTPRHWHIYLHMFTHSMSVTHLHILPPHNWHRYLHVLFTPCQSQMYISSLTLYDICIYMSSLPVIEKSICIYSLPVIDICFYMSSLIPSLTHYMPSLTPCHWYVSICPRSLSLRRVAIYPHSVIDMCIYMSSPTPCDWHVYLHVLTPCHWHVHVDVCHVGEKHLSLTDTLNYSVLCLGILTIIFIIIKANPVFLIGYRFWKSILMPRVMDCRKYCSVDVQTFYAH